MQSALRAPSPETLPGRRHRRNGTNRLLAPAGRRIEHPQPRLLGHLGGRGGTGRRLALDGLDRAGQLLSPIGRRHGVRRLRYLARRRVRTTAKLSTAGCCSTPWAAASRSIARRRYAVVARNCSITNGQSDGSLSRNCSRSWSWAVGSACPTVAVRPLWPAFSPGPAEGARQAMSGLRQTGRAAACSEPPAPAAGWTTPTTHSPRAISPREPTRWSTGIGTWSDLGVGKDGLGMIVKMSGSCKVEPPTIRLVRRVERAEVGATPGHCAGFTGFSKDSRCNRPTNRPR